MNITSIVIVLLLDVVVVEVVVIVEIYLFILDCLHNYITLSSITYFFTYKKIII